VLRPLITLAPRRRFWLSPFDLQLERKSSAFKLVAKPVLAGLLAVLLLFTATLAASPSLHQLLHDNTAADSHFCAVCLLAQGQVQPTEIIPVICAFIFSLLLLVFTARAAACLQIDCRLSRSRAPPSFLLSLVG
jgi:hypothetical protein